MARRRQDPKVAALRAERSLNPRPEDVVDEAFLGERRREVRAALKTLPPEQHEVLEMAYFGGMTQVQIAEKLQIPIGTVKTRTLAAMKKLRRALQQEDDA